MKEHFKDFKFRTATRRLIAEAEEIIDEYSAQGFELTLRQLYYQFVARGLMENSQLNYKRLGETVSKARLAGLLDWDVIVDRTRNLVENSHWSNPESIISSAASGYAIDKWADQDYRVEVWIEKEALVGVIERSCEDLDVPFFACRGYVSQSEQWRAGRRFRRYIKDGQAPVVIHLGDHDPSGIDMTRDNAERLEMFSWDYIEVERIALNWDQVEKYNPPPNPAKMTDSRFGGYVTRFGNESWELDALDPKVLRELIEKEVLKYRDPDKWDAAVAREGEEKDSLFELSDNYTKVIQFLNSEEGAE